MGIGLDDIHVQYAATAFRHMRRYLTGTIAPCVCLMNISKTRKDSADTLTCAKYTVIAQPCTAFFRRVYTCLCTMLLTQTSVEHSF